MIQQGQQALELFQYIAQRLDSKLKKPIRKFFIPLIIGALFAIARRRNRYKMNTSRQTQRKVPKHILSHARHRMQ
jgi:hypothetical protein